VSTVYSLITTTYGRVSGSSGAGFASDKGERNAVEFCLHL
jgi:hypothetical protein